MIDHVRRNAVLLLLPVLLGVLAGCASTKPRRSTPAPNAEPGGGEVPAATAAEPEEAPPGTLYDVDRGLHAGNYLINLTAGLAVGTLLHETGHAMVAYTAGARITRFNILLAHGDVEYEGELTRDQQAGLAVNGMVTTRAVSEVLTWQLQRGRIDEDWEPFVATTALICRGDAYKQIVQGMFARSSRADAVGFVKNSNFSRQALLGIMVADIGIDLLWRHDMEHLWGIARGKKSYHPPAPKPTWRIEADPERAAVTITIPF